MTSPLQSSGTAVEPSVPAVTLVIFSCTGREHLLKRTLESFRQHCPYSFAKTILAMDGEMPPACLSWANPTHIVQSLQREGYIQSILRALSLVRTPFLFWLEDDWTFNQPVNLPSLVEALASHAAWTQIRLSKIAPLAGNERNTPLDTPGLFCSTFSANPHLGRANHLLDGFRAFLESPKTVENTFEPFLNEWFGSKALTCAMLDPGLKPAIEHTGYLESTGRQWHSAISLPGKPAKYSSGLHQDGSKPPLWRRIILASRLVIASIRIGFRALYKHSAYDLGFRFIDLSRRKGE